MLKNYAAAIAFLCTAANAHADGAVDFKGFHAKVRSELTDLGHLGELNGKYHLRVTETTIDPAGYMRAHHHVGPGVRCLQSGELTYTIGGKTVIYKAGDCFTETGNITHDANNAGAAPVVLLNFELLPASLPESKTSLIPVPGGEK